MQEAKAEAVRAIERVGRTIGQVSEISLSVSSAVTQQAAVTRDMSVNLQNAAESVQRLRVNMDRIAAASRTVDARVQTVAEAARKLA